MKDPIEIIINHLDLGVIDDLKSVLHYDQENERFTHPAGWSISVNLFNQILANPDFFRD